MFQFDYSFLLINWTTILGHPPKCDFTSDFQTPAFQWSNMYTDNGPKIWGPKKPCDLGAIWDPQTQRAGVVVWRCLLPPPEWSGGFADSLAMLGNSTDRDVEGDHGWINQHEPTRNIYKFIQSVSFLLQTMSVPSFFVGFTRWMKACIWGTLHWSYETGGISANFFLCFQAGFLGKHSPTGLFSRSAAGYKLGRGTWNAEPMMVSWPGEKYSRTKAVKREAIISCQIE